MKYENQDDLSKSRARFDQYFTVARKRPVVNLKQRQFQSSRFRIVVLGIRDGDTKGVITAVMCTNSNDKVHARHAHAPDCGPGNPLAR